MRADDAGDARCLMTSPHLSRTFAGLVKRGPGDGRGVLAQVARETAHISVAGKGT